MTHEQHEMLQRDLVARLEHNGYSHIYQNMEYRVKIHHHEYIGEVDVLAKSPKGKWHFYEVKTSRHKYDYAHQQYMRFCNAHPYLDTRGVFVSMKKVCFL